MQFSALLAANFANGDSYTQLLGFVAVLAFVATAGWVISIVLKESAKKQSLEAAKENFEIAAPVREDEAKQAFEEEVSRIQEEYAEFFDEVIESAQTKLGELVVHARLALQKVSMAYAKICRNPDAEHPGNLAKRYVKAIEDQWHYFKADLGYIGYQEVDPYMGMIFTNQEILEQMGPMDSEDDFENMEMSPAMMRAQQTVLLQKSIPPERMGSFKMDSVDAVGPFEQYYKRCVKEWIDEVQFKIVAKIREKGAKGASIKDTDLKERFIRLKKTLDIIGRLSERMDSNMNNIGEEDAAFSQIIFGSAVLSLLSETPEWFPELGDSQVEEEEAPESSASAAVES